MSRQVSVTLNGQHIATGVQVPVHYAFWHAVEVDEICDMDVVLDRLANGLRESQIHFEHRAGSRIIHLPPVYEISESDVIV